MKALVVGGGVAGPAVALALQEVGIDVVVLEARTVRGDGGRVLPDAVAERRPRGRRSSACSRTVRDLGFPTRRNDLVSGTGRPLGSVTLGEPLARRHDRADPRAAGPGRGCWPTEAARRGVEVRYDARVVAVHEHADRAEGRG